MAAAQSPDAEKDQTHEPEEDPENPSRQPTSGGRTDNERNQEHPPRLSGGLGTGVRHAGYAD
jgi:hypothetical protein